MHLYSEAIRGHLPSFEILEGEELYEKMPKDRGIHEGMTDSLFLPAPWWGVMLRLVLQDILIDTKC